jgi:hypothetical protein
MTELYDQAPPDASDFVVAWLSPLGACWSNTPTDKTLPYRVVNVIHDVDDVSAGTATAVVSVHTFAGTFGAAKAAAKEAHQRMLVIADNPLTDVLMPGGAIGNAYCVSTVQRPIHVDYGDTAIKRFVARYELDFSFVAVP